MLIYPGQRPDVVARVQEFRGRIYLAEGAIAGLDADGRHVEAADARAFHLVSERAGSIDGCLRYERIGLGRARVGGWAVAPDARRGLGILLVEDAVELAAKLGDHYATATATTRNHSAAMLSRMGARLVARYYDPAYRCEMELLEFYLSDFRRRHLIAA